ncbi:PQQ-dependent sugar dehydrogenase [Nocardioides dongkuii]|uniref:PQQ-dependent sugar dehydrogenase n=1 Tax=Nocardioides dongkuii TaxID=2760089 RepID=UPI0015FA8E95|nr:PQQ-dependent sugar dehydrogenase [Nocardioides dongkuii]
MLRISVATAAFVSLGLLAPALPSAAVPSAAVAAPYDGGGAVASAGASAQKRKAPRLRVRRVLTGLDIPWDVQAIDGGRLLVTERDSARLLVADPSGRTRAVDFPSGKVWVSGETGLMSLAVDPAFESNRRIYTCQGGFRRGGRDVRVVAWELDEDATKVSRIRTLLRGLPATSGRHGGCRLLIAADGSLLVGTGDAGVSRNPRNLRSLGGKTLRLDRFTGKPWRRNPFAGSKHRAKRYVYTYGHRNVQGLAQRKDGSLWSVEHGSYRDDEVNKLVRGGDYGWQPGPGYDESSPMTDRSLPGKQRGARWRSGTPTIATSGATFVRGRDWGSLNGSLAVAALGGERFLFLRFTRGGKLRSVTVPGVLRRYGRLRSVSTAPDGDLLVTTSNGGGNDSVLRISPR